MHHHLGLTFPSAVTAVAASHPSGLDNLEAALLSMAVPDIDSRVVVLAPGALELSCALLRQGHGDVSMIRLSDHPRTGEADVAFIPHVASTKFLERALTCLRRILLPQGTLTLALASDLPHGAVQHARRQLRLHGFTAVRTRTLDDGIIMRAKLSRFGDTKCA